MAGVLDLWSKWEVQILMLGSFALQVFLLLFAGLRRRNIPPVLRIIIWLMYLSADSIALYILGHMSFGSSKQTGEFMALWASFLLVHLGGQDTITAYAMEDNNLWLRHLFTLAVQAAGAAYVLYKHIPSSERWLLAAAILMLAIGVVKYAERVWSLKTANLQSVSRFLDGVKILRQQVSVSPPHPHALLDDEVVLQGAHDLLYHCMGQFVDYRVWPNDLQCHALNLFDKHKKMYELVEMQLSLMYDVFYTKAVVAHTTRGLCIRAASLLGTATACVLFQLNAAGSSDTVDAAVTQVLLFGACLLEVASVLVTLMSTWTCAALKARGWQRLHRLLVSLRRLVKAARIRSRRWSGSIGQHNLVDSSGGEATSLGSRVFSFLARGNSTISPEAKELVLEEICRMVQACGGNEDVMRSYRGHQVQLDGTDGEVLEYIKSRIEFDESILIWHFTTDVLLYFYEQQEQKNVELAQATKAVSNYMVSLFVEHPHMLPSPVRSRLYDSTKQKLVVIQLQLPWTRWNEYPRRPLFERIRNEGRDNTDEHGNPRSTRYALDDPPETLVLAERLASDLLLLEESIGMTEVLQAVFRVWVEKLSYAAHHCSRDSHARQLSNGGGELVTVVWLLASAVLKTQNSAHDWFRRRATEFFYSRRAMEIQGPRLCDALAFYCSHCCLFCFDPCSCCGCGGIRRAEM